MIIKKSMFKYNRRYRGQWPFTVDEVSVLKLNIDKHDTFAVIHNFIPYAMSGLLENQGFPPLIDSGIWADDGEAKNTRAKKSLNAMFDFVIDRSKGAGVKQK